MPLGIPLLGSHYQWPVLRADREFRVFLVEPAIVAPKTHASIFNGALSSLISPPAKLLSSPGSNYSPGPIAFDLVTFPEAFLPAAELVETLNFLSALGEPLGCVHVGLRPDHGSGHLFNLEQLHALLEKLAAIPQMALDDLTAFTKWVDKLSAGHFNVACLFAIDADNRTRVCLHPKMVRSKFEAQSQPEDDMTEGNVVSLVTLVPRDPTFLTTTLQPLICSDVLMLDTGGGKRPISAISDHADCFDERPPDHVDLVSVATCTPQLAEQGVTSIGTSRRWQQSFRNSFTDAIGHARHTKAAFVMSNFLSVAAGARGGLSGAYLPINIHVDDKLTWIEPHQYGADKNDSDNRWLTLGHPKPGEGRRVRANLIQLRAFEDEAPPHRMLGFIIDRLPRHVSPWSSTQTLRSVTLRYGTFDQSTERVVFSEVAA